MGYTWQYYDLLLVAIIGSMGLGAGVGALTTVSLVVSIVAFSLVAAGLIGHGLFVNGPVDEPGDLAEEVDALN